MDDGADDAEPHRGRPAFQIAIPGPATPEPGTENHDTSAHRTIAGAPDDPSVFSGSGFSAARCPE